MKDRVDKLKRQRIVADCIDSTKTPEERRRIYKSLEKGSIRLLYCSPERLSQEHFMTKVQQIPGGVRLLAVDETHCVEEWGHSFRPDYLKVAAFAHKIKAERTICLTATATEKVSQDICKTFKIQPEGVFRTSPYRPNLNLYVKATKTKGGKYTLLLQFLRENSGPTIVLVTLRKEANVLATKLQEHGFSAEAFHSSLDSKKKTIIQEKFLVNKVRIVVATIAFGMGIDKRDIRNIVNFDLPSSIEEYCQQIGRAG